MVLELGNGQLTRAGPLGSRRSTRSTLRAEIARGLDDCACWAEAAIGYEGRHMGRPGVVGDAREEPLEEGDPWQWAERGRSEAQKSGTPFSGVLPAALERSCRASSQRGARRSQTTGRGRFARHFSFRSTTGAGLANWLVRSLFGPAGRELGLEDIVEMALQAKGSARRWEHSEIQTRAIGVAVPSFVATANSRLGRGGEGVALPMMAQASAQPVMLPRGRGTTHRQIAARRTELRDAEQDAQRSTSAGGV